MEENKLQILIAIESFFDGGAEMFAIRLANKLSEAHNVFFIELYPWLTIEKRQKRLLNLERIQLFDAGKSFMWPWRQKKNGHYEATSKEERATRLLYSREVMKFIRRNHISVVNSHSWDSDIYFANLKKELDFKLVASFHGHYEFDAGKIKSFDTVTATALQNIDTIVYTAPQHVATLDRFKYPRKKMKRIFYGVDLPASVLETSCNPEDTLQLVMVARGIREKGWEEAIQAALLLDEKWPGKVKLTLAGSGKYLDKLKTEYAHPAIIFAGYHHNAIELVEKAHIGLLPTWYDAESLPNSVIEYLSCGKPVIATNTGAIKEMISVGGEMAGTLIDLENGMVNREALAAAIENYLIHPELVKKHSSIASEAAQKFSIEKCVDGYLTVFTDLQKEIKVHE